MARINIEDSLFKDVRFDDLKMKLGSVDTALGAMVRAWSLAQQWYLKEETSRLIPVSEWKKQRINDSIIEVGLAEMRGDFVYVSGSDEQFAWLVQRKEAGKKGGRPSNKPQSNTEKVPVSSDKVPVPPVTDSNPLSLSLSLPLPHDINNNIIGDGSPEPLETPVSPSQVLFCIWNEHRGQLPEALALTKKRESAAKQRWKEVPDEDYWRSVVIKMASSPFHCGHNDRNWRADFDFFLKPDTHVKITERGFGHVANKNSTMGVLGG